MASRSFSNKEMPDVSQAARSARLRAKRLIEEPGEVGAEDARLIMDRVAQNVILRGNTLPDASVDKSSKTSDSFSIRLGSGKGIEGCRIPMDRKSFRAIQSRFEELRSRMLLRKEVSKAYGITFKHKELEVVLTIMGEKVSEPIECAVLEVEHMSHKSEMSRLEATAVLNILKHEIINMGYQDSKVHREQQAKQGMKVVDVKLNGMEIEPGMNIHLRRN